MIYLLNRNEEHVGYDEFDAKIVRAKSEAEARELANQRTGDEGAIWADTTRVKCEVVDPAGPSEVLLGSFNAG